MLERIRVDAQSMKKLVVAAVAGDGEACRVAIGEMALASKLDDDVLSLIQRARKQARGIVDKEVTAFPLPVPGLKVGSTLYRPIAAPAPTDTAA